MQPPSFGRVERPPSAAARWPLSRVVAIVLAVAALSCGVYGLTSLSAESLDMGLIVFGCLLAILALLAQSAEHFTRAGVHHE